MEEIGSAVPKGVVDVQKGFVGIQFQKMNPHRELARLRKQVRQIRTRAENMGLLSQDGRQRTNKIAALAVIAGITGFAVAVWRSRSF
ncbi:MAG TPA: hypothetical protein VGN93_04375 [Shinella sp.]|jgi:hypothetical protein|uniref:hypothetical protein n=1 Tax=Shinella sp. TaxID=1870904 RepID=UPI002E0F170B|nr:hypothetical protein [Shinella sp.]